MCPIVSPRMVNTKSDAMLAFVLFPSWQDLTRSLAGLGDTFQQAKICTAPPMFLSRAFQKTRRKAGPLWVLCLRCLTQPAEKNKTECRHLFCFPLGTSFRRLFFRALKRRSSRHFFGRLFSRSLQRRDSRQFFGRLCFRSLEGRSSRQCAGALRDQCRSCAGSVQDLCRKNCPKIVLCDEILNILGRSGSPWGPF